MLEVAIRMVRCFALDIIDIKRRCVCVQIRAYAEKMGVEIVGYYHANEHAAATRPCETAFAVANTIHHNERRSCLLLVSYTRAHACVPSHTFRFWWYFVNRLHVYIFDLPRARAQQQKCKPDAVPFTVRWQVSSRDT